jgi:hypothetical protein
VLSLALNLAGLTWGLPARWHPDEKAGVVARMLTEGSLRPDSFINPSLAMNLTLPFVGLQQVAASAGLLAGRGADPLLAMRVASALAWAAAVVVVGRASRSIHPRLGPWPAVFLAVAPAAVNLGHFATPEAWLVLGVSATLALALDHLRGRAPAWAVGIALGLAASTKYTAAALAVPALIAVAWRPSDGRRSPSFLALALLALAAGAGLWLSGVDSLAPRLRLDDPRMLQAPYAFAFLRKLALGLALAGTAGVVLWGLAERRIAWAARVARTEVAALAGAAIGGFVVGSPYALIDPIAFLSGLAFNDQTRFEYKGLTGSTTSFGPYLALMADALTWPLLAAALLGLAVCAGRALRRDPAALVLGTGLLVPYLLVASSGHRALRFVAPALPAAAWVAALGLAALPARVRAPIRWLVAARAALGAVLVVRLFFVDSRIVAERWLGANTPPGATIDLVANAAGYAPTAPPGRTLRMVPTLSREMAPAERFEEAAARYPSEGATWLVLTASFYERFLDHPQQRPERARFFRALLDGRLGYVEAARFRQRGWLRPPAEFLDPEIVVMRKAGQIPTR